MAAGKVDNLQEELLRTKKVHAFTTREVSILRTRIKILEKECKKKDQQIDDLLKDDQPTTKSEQRLEINSLKRKVVQFERKLREKTEEVARLLSDRNVVKAAETRDHLDQLTAECARLRRHLSNSIPKTEFLYEKHQYMDVIGQLTDENIEMRRIIGQLKERASISIDLDLNEEVIMEELRNMSLAKKRDVQHYKSALSSLINKRNSRSSNNNWDQKPPHQQANRSRSACTTNNPTRRKLPPFNKSFPVRSQPALSKVAAFHSKSTDEVSRANQKHQSKQRVSTGTNSKVEGHEVLIPVKRNVPNSVMYRNALESSSSSEQLDDTMNDTNRLFTDDTALTVDSKDDELDELPPVDVKGYYTQPDEGEENSESEMKEPNEDDTSMVFDPDEVVGTTKKQRSTDAWLEGSSMMGSQTKFDEEIITRTLLSHILRLRMLQIRQEI